MLTILGVPFSAHTRKVIMAAREKQLPYELRALVPLQPELPQTFVDASPLRKIPVLIHAGLAIADSTVIALYLDRVFPERPLYPPDPAAYAQALFVEELVDGALAHHVLHGLLLQRVFGPKFLGSTPDEALITASLEQHIPPRLADLEARLGQSEWFAGSFSYADVTVASILMNMAYAGESLDRSRFPKLHAFLRRALTRDTFAAALKAEAPAARDVGGLDLRLLEELGY
ncbi:MAG: glutathione S-transferase family protein [Polyangiaceae bacterium]